MGNGAATALIRGMRTSVRNNSAAYGYSVTITATFGAVTALTRKPNVPDIFLFLGGAAAAFTLVELLASKGFKVTDHSEPEEVILVAASFNVFSIASGVAGGCLAAWLLSRWIAWLIGPFAATVVYLFVVGVELAVAERAERRNGSPG